jgi:hypothetical protein
MNKWVTEIASKLNEQVDNNKMEAIVNKSNYSINFLIVI